MIIDFVNYTLYDPGAEASILFRLHECGLRVPRFFCVTEQYEPEEMDAYFATHFQDVLQFHVRMTATIKNGKTDKTGRIPVPEITLPVYTNIKKNVLYRYVERLLQERDTYRQQIMEAESVASEQISFHIIIQEIKEFTEFGVIDGNSADGILNETRIQMGCGWNADLVWQDTPTMQICYHDTDHILYYDLPDGQKPLEPFLLWQIEKAVQIVKSQFGMQLQVSVFVESETQQLFAITVRRTMKPPCEGILFDSRSVLSTLYPTTCTPLMASYMQNMYNHVIYSFFKRTLHVFKGAYQVPEITEDIVIYINGRIYFCAEHWNELLHYFPTFNKQQSFKNVYALLHDKEGLRSWLVHRYVSFISNQMRQSDFKTVQEKLQLLVQKIEKYQSYDFSEMSLAELNKCYRTLHSTMIACWHYTLLGVLNSRIAIQRLRKSLEKMNRNIPFSACYQYAAGMLPVPPEAGKRLKKRIAVAQKSENYRKQFLKQQDQLVTLFKTLFQAAGKRLEEAGCLSNAEDVHYLTLKEVRASMEDPSIRWDAEKPKWRKAAYEWYQKLPNYTEMVLQEKCIGQREEPLTQIVFPSGNGKTQGRPCMPGMAKGSVIICNVETKLDAKQLEGKILVAEHLSKELLLLPLKGLIIEEEQTYEEVAALASPNVSFPVLTGVRAASSLLQYTQQVSLNGWTGEIHAKGEQASFTQNQWAGYQWKKIQK